MWDLTFSFNLSIGRRWLAGCLLVAILLGLIPPPLTSLLDTAQVVQAAPALLPAAQGNPSAIGNTVWKDINANGLQDSGEPGIPGVTVGLYDASGNAVQCTAVGRYDTYRDEFSTTSNTNSNGRLDWTGNPWVLTNGAVIIASSGNPGGSLRILTTNTLYSATRPVDLSVFAGNPTLSFDYNMGGLASQFNIQYSSNGGASFTTLATLSDNNSTYKTITYTLPIQVANAQIRIAGSGVGNNNAYFDNLTIRGQVRYPVTSVTDANGLYTFTDAQCVQPSTTYQVRIDVTQNALIGVAAVTTQNAGGVTSNDPTGDDSDSDAVSVTLNNQRYAQVTATSLAAGVNPSYDFGFVPDRGAIIIRKATTLAGSNQSFSFTSNVFEHTNFTVSDGGSYIMTNVPIGTYAVTETAPSGWTQAASTCTTGSTIGAIQVTKAVTTTCTVLNAVQPTNSNVLTVTKTVNWNGNTPNPTKPFNINITGPSFPSGKADTITAGATKIYTNVVAGVYTVTETSPGSGWVTTYSVPSGVVNLSGASIAPTTAGPISGRVYQDFNSNGQIDSSGTVVDVGLAGLTVVAYDPNGVVVGTATTNATGNYGFTPTKPGPYRVELQSTPSGYYPTTHGTGNGTSVQFVTTNGGASNVNFGLLAPCDYCQNNPRFATVVQHTGDTRTSTLDALVTDDFATATSKQVLTQYSATGTLWGLAYDRTRKTLYSGSYLKTHLGLQENMGATNPLGAIYQTNAATGATSLFVDISTLGADVGTIPSNATRGVNTQPSLDTQAFTQTMKVGLGDIDISQDDKTLYAMSLNDKTLYLIDIATKQLTRHYSLADLGDCTGGAFRPFAIGINLDKVYVGGVCDAEASQNANNLQAQVYLLTGNRFTSVLTVPLNYVKGANDTRAACSNKWYPWITKMAQVTCFYPLGAYVTQASPALVDINFDVDGAMILGLRDRTGDQFATGNQAPNGTAMDVIVGGDLLKACWSGTAYVLENNGQCGGLTTSGANNHQGPGGGEFYAGDTSQTYNQENSQGGAALLPGSNQIAVATMDPAVTFSGGVTWYLNTTGAATRDATYYVAGLSKGNGIGDLELLCDPAPLEIGNRVWKDLNGNGVQDPGEPGINGVQVSLQGPTTTVTINTSSDGNYYFGSLRPNTAYTLTINPSQVALSGLSLTQANMQAGPGGAPGSTSSNDPIRDTRDSDAVTIGGQATIFYTTGLAGQNNHGLDFGFTQPLSGQVVITNTAPTVVSTASYVLSKQRNTPAPLTLNAAVSFTLRITNTGNTVITLLPLEDRYQSAYLQYVSASPAADSTANGVLTWNNLAGSGLAPNTVAQVVVYFTALADTTLLSPAAPCTQSGVTTNLAIVRNAQAGATAITPDATACATVPILAPTAVTLAEHSVTYANNQVTVQWHTENEAQIVSFNLLRVDLQGTVVKLNEQAILAQHSGQNEGVSYSFVDSTAAAGHRYRYILEVTDLNGQSSYNEIGELIAAQNVYLPMIGR